MFPGRILQMTVHHVDVGAIVQPRCLWYGRVSDVLLHGMMLGSIRDQHCRQQDRRSGSG